MGSHAAFKQQFVFKVLFALSIGVMLTTLCLWLMFEMERRHSEQLLQYSHEQTVSRLSQIVTKVESFVDRNSHLGHDCSPDNIEIFRDAIFELSPVSEVGIVKADGTISCTSWGDGRFAKAVASPPFLSRMDVRGPHPARMTGQLAVLLVKGLADGGAMGALLPLHIVDHMVHSSDSNGIYTGLIDTIGHRRIRSGPQQAPIALPNKRLGGLQSFNGPVPERFDDDQLGYYYSSPLLGLSGISVVTAQKVRDFYSDTLYVLPWMAFPFMFFSGMAFYAQGWFERRNTSMRRQLMNAIDQEQIINVYQPLIDVVSDKMLGVETLCRWQHPREGLLGPGVFIPEAERTGLIVDMAIAQLEAAAFELADILKEHPQFKVTFNVSGQHLDSDSFLEALYATHQKIPGLCIELTERDLLKGDSIQPILDAIHERDIGIAIDDFGVGYSGLQYLQQFPVDTIKIDRCFIATIGTDALSAPVLDGIIELGNRLGIELLAEGVETAVQAYYLRESGVYLHQGWHYSAAVNAYDLKAQLDMQAQTAWLEEKIAA